MTVMIPTPQSDVDDLDAVIRALGIEDSNTTPAEAVADLHAEIERLRADLAARQPKVTEAAFVAAINAYWEYVGNTPGAIRSALEAALPHLLAPGA